MANDASEIMIAKGGAISVAPAGTTLPNDTDPRDTLDGAFNEVGFITEDGAALGAAIDLIEVMAQQSARAVRRDVNTRDYTMAYGLEQWNSDNLAHAFGGGQAITTAPGVTRYDFPADEDALDELSLVCDWEDHGFEYRLVWDRGTVTEGVETSLIRTGPAILPVTYKALEPETLDVPLFLVTDDPAFSPVS